MANLLQDFGYGLRMLRRSPGFAAVAILTLALGIGANTAIFSVVNAVLLRPLPYREPGRIVTLWSEDPEPLKPFFGQRAGRWSDPLTTRFPISGPAFLEMRAELRSFEELAAASSGARRGALTGAGEPQEIRLARISANLLPLLGVRPVIGRGFFQQEERVGADRVALLAYALWQQRWGGDPKVLGTTVIVGGESFTVVGIMPPGFRLPEADLWIPLAFGRRMFGAGACELTHDCWNFLPIARLAPGVSRERALEELRAFAARKKPVYRVRRAWTLTLLSLPEHAVSGGTRKPLLILLGAVSLVLLIACANVANLLLMRAAGRRRELAVRAAIGAGRFRILRQLLAESVLLWLIGGVLGLLLAVWGTDLLVTWSPKNIPRLDEIGLDWRVLGFTVLLSLLTAVLFGLIPAVPASRADVNEALKESGGPAHWRAGRHGLRGALVVAEVSLALVLLAGAGLLMNTFIRLWSAPLGFLPENLLTMRIPLPRHKYADRSRAAAFFTQLLERVHSIPGVMAAAGSDPLPFSGERNYVGARLAASSEPFFTNYREVTPGYLSAMRIPLLKGRWFDQRDLGREPEYWKSGAEGAPGVMVINETMARRLWPNEDPLGKRVFFSSAGGRPSREVIGVVGDARHAGLDREPGLEVYAPSMGAPPFLAVRTRSDPFSTVAAVRAQVQALDKDQPVEDVRTMQQLLAESVAPWRFNLLVLAFFSAVSVALAAVGIYGVMSHAAAERRREIGIRMALGARRADVLRLVIGQALALTAAGVAVGTAGALAATRVLANLLYEVRPTDPPTFFAVALLLALVALAAGYLPARRASRADPMAALRHE